MHTAWAKKAAKRRIQRTDRFILEQMEMGKGRATVLLHSSASTAAQWQALAADLVPGRRIIAPNLFGYGQTSPWPHRKSQTVSDQAGLVLASIKDEQGPVDFVGHSFGAVVALETAMHIGPRIGRLVLFEPNPFALLRASEPKALAEIETIYAQLRKQASLDNWMSYAALFTDYFSGDGSWLAMPEERQKALAAMVKHNPYEWEAVMDFNLEADRWSTIQAPILLINASDTRPHLKSLINLLLETYPRWKHAELSRGGHMAPILRARSFNAEVKNFLDQ